MSGSNNFDSYQNGLEFGNFISVFRKKTERINWRLLAGVDVEKVIQQNDIPVLRQNIKHLAFCDIENEIDSRNNDKNLLKIFKLTQLMVDYLLSSQEYLENARITAEERAQLLMEETDTAKRKLQENDAYISEIKRECHRRKKLILAQQQIMDSGPNAYHRCPYCEKAFLNGSFLQAHLEKRHADRYIKDWYINESQRKKSPKREHSEEFPGQKDKTLELILQKLMEQRNQSPRQHRNNDEDLRHLANEFDKERREWQLMMQRMQNEIDDLKDQLNQANQKPRSYLKNLEDDDSTKEDIERARQKAIEDHRKKPIYVFEEPIVKQHVNIPQKKMEEKRSKKKKMKFSESINNQPSLSSSLSPSLSQSLSPSPKPKPEKRQVESPIRISPRPTVSSPVHRNSIDKELPIRESFIKTSNIVIENLDNLDNLGIDFTQDLIEKFCNEVRHMLDDHLEMHGIQRGTTGISGAILNDKLKLMDHEQSQLKLKYPNYAQIRKRLETEVEEEAARRLVIGTSKPQTKLSSENKLPERVKPQLSARIFQSNQSEWDGQSHGKPEEKHGSPMKSPIVNKITEIESKKVNNRSASPSPTRKNNVHVSSDLSNTIDSSAWQTESKAVTSVAQPGQGLRPVQTNKSSEFDDESSFSR